MIEFKTIKWKNLLSYGNNWNTFDFETGIHKIQAKNGMGKSSIIDALYFAMYGKAYRKIKIKQLINSKNKKGLEVILTFSKGEYNYRVERSVKPDAFKIYMNDELVPVASSKRGYQTILDEDIFGFSENLTNQVTIKSLTKAVSFMTLEKAEKRAIIENLFDIEIFTAINKNIKTRVDALELELKSTKKDLDNTDLLIGQELSNIETLRNLAKRLKEESDQLIAGYTKEISDLETANVKFKKGIEIINKNKDKKYELDVTLKKLNESLYAVHQAITTNKATIQANEKKAQYLKNVCGDCPKITLVSGAKEVTECNIRVEESVKVANEIAAEIAPIKEEIIKIDNILSNERFVVSSLQANTEKIGKLTKQIDNIKTKVVVVDETKLKEYNSKRVELHKTYNEIADDKTHLQLLRGLYSDDGIKPIIIKKYLPSINKLLNTYLIKFNASMIFNFDADFNEVILTKNKEDYSYYNFSEGEKKRIDLAILFTFIKFAMHKNKKANTNLLIFDEVMSGLDIYGTTALFDILKDHKDYQNKCIITINHNSDLDDAYFDHMYEIVTESGFSKIVELK